MLALYFETERLIAEPMGHEATDFIFQLLNTEGWIKNIGNRNIATKSDAAAYITRITTNPKCNYWVFKNKTNLYPLGIVTLVKRDYLNDYDIGFAILPEFANKGYAYEASKKLLELVIEKNICKKIVAITLPENASSIALIEKLGLWYDSETKEEDGTVLFVYQKILAE